MEDERDQLPPAWLGLIYVLGIVGVAAAVFYWASRGSLWEDEIIAVTHGLTSLPQFFFEVLRNDIHPFAYFLFVKAWALVAPANDAWLLASSLVLGIVSAALIAFIAYRIGGPTAAAWAFALFCLQPTFAWASGNLRMYTFVPVLALLFWYASRRFLQIGGRRYLALASAAQLLLLWTHAIEFFFVFFLVLVLWFEARRSGWASHLRTWYWMQGLALMAALPVVGSALVRGTEPLPASSLELLARMPAQLVAGWALSEDTLALVAGAAIFFVLALFCLRQPSGRWLLFGAVLAPLFTAAAIGLAGKPMFKPPVFTANILPFLVLGAALGLARVEHRGVSALMTAAAAVLAAVVLPWSQRLLPPENFAPAGEFLKQAVQPGDMVVVPRMSVFWGVARYAISPAWGDPLKVLPPSNPQWAGVENRMPLALKQLLGLEPRSNVIEVNGVLYVHGRHLPGPLADGSRVWVVHRKRYADRVTTLSPVTIEGVFWFGDEVSVTKATPRPDGVLSLPNPP